ncbi:MAG: radical SAM protein [Deltaproteobacteria bacterium]|nr:radical SAM protein [Deltaproteobacteria bacterium]
MNIFEQGPIRPPSEAKSLLIRVTRNCPWNKCAFCHTYRGAAFSLRTVEEVKKDVAAIVNVAGKIKERSRNMGFGGAINEAVVEALHKDPTSRNTDCSVAAWLYFGGKSVFLQDADSLIAKTDDLIKILQVIKGQFPQIDRITSYCRSKTACRKSIEDFRRLREAGLSRIHVGFESGSDSVLQEVRKGVTAREHIEGGRRIRESGISLCLYVMPGLGGVSLSRDHAVETARVLNEINPQFIRLRSLAVKKGTVLHDLMEQGTFTPLDDDDVIREIRLLIDRLEGINSTVVSDHILNLLEELEGTFPKDKGKLLNCIDRYLSLSDDDRRIYRLGRRKGLYRSLDDLSDRGAYKVLKDLVDSYGRRGWEHFDKDIQKHSGQFI